MKKILTIIIFFLEGGLITFGQNAITLDPTTIGNVQSRTLSEGVGGKTDTLRLSSTGYNLYYLGMKSTTPLAVSGSIASIYGRASNATGQNVGVIGYANPSLSSNVGYGVWGNAYGDNNILVGLRGSVTETLFPQLEVVFMEQTLQQILRLIIVLFLEYIQKYHKHLMILQQLPFDMEFMLLQPERLARVFTEYIQKLVILLIL